MSPLDPGPSPERDPQHSEHRPRRPDLVLRELDPLGAQIQIDNLDRLTDVLHLCGITSSDPSIEYLWSSLLTNKLPSLETFREAQGPLGVSLELDLTTKHEVEWRGHAIPERTEFDDRLSVILSTRHRDGSDLSALTNLSEGSPALEGLFVEILATPLGDFPAVANIYWEEQTLSQGSPGERWELLRGFYHFFRNRDLPESAPLAPGQREKFHYLTVDIDPLLVKVQRLTPCNSTDSTGTSVHSSPSSRANQLELRLKNPPLSAIETALSMSEALQLKGDWVDETSRHVILSHLFDTVLGMEKLNIDTLKMCENALPCLVFSREHSSDGAIFPPRMSSKIRMVDYTCKKGDLRLELTQDESTGAREALLQWEAKSRSFDQGEWERLKAILGPYLADS